MAFYVSVPRDLSRVKTKVFFRLTKRQVICFTLAAAIGVPVYFLTKDLCGAGFAMYAMIISMMPLFLMALYEKNGKPAEVWMSYYLESRVLRPRIRPYRVCNRYAKEMLSGKKEKKDGTF